MKSTVLILALLTGCAVFDPETIQRDLNRLIAAELVVDWHLADSTKLQPAEIAAREEVAGDLLAEACVRPISARVSERQRLMPTIDTLAAARLDFESALVECYRRRGYTAAVFWRPAGGLELTSSEINAQAFNLYDRLHSPYPLLVGGCGTRGGPGYRRADGRCASWLD